MPMPQDPQDGSISEQAADELERRETRARLLEDDGPDNSARVEHAAIALRNYTEDKGETYDGGVDQLVDLMTDLLHYAAEHDFDLDYVRRVSLAHFEEER